MDRVAAFVDAGYLFAQGSVALAGERKPRGQIRLDHERAIQALEDFSKAISGLPLLRIYWYDGTSTGPTPQHLVLAHLSRVKLRLGFVNSQGEQKGVDSLIVTDMITLARNRGMSDAVLMSGDEDLRVGVQQAQEFGVRVHLLGIRPSRGSQSLFLLQESDTTHEWGPADLEPFLSIPAAVPNTREVADSQRTETALGVLTGIAEQLARTIPITELRDLVLSIKAQGQTPKELDGKLLAQSRARLKRDMDPGQKRHLREAFLKACEALLPAE